jgi:hypothetical protein
MVLCTYLCAYVALGFGLVMRKFPAYQSKFFVSNHSELKHTPKVHITHSKLAAFAFDSLVNIRIIIQWLNCSIWYSHIILL